MPSLFGTSDVRRRAAHTSVKPACYCGVPNEAGGTPGELGKNCLRNVFCQGAVPSRFTNGSRVDEVDVSIDQFPEGAFRALLCVSLQQSVIRIHLRLYNNVRRREKPHNLSDGQNPPTDPGPWIILGASLSRTAGKR